MAKTKDTSGHSPGSIQSVELPTRQRGSRYDWPDADVDQARELLRNGGHPGAGGYDKPTAARAAGQRLADAIGDDDVSIRVWETDDGAFAFGLRYGRRHRRQAAPQDGPPPEPEN